MMADTNNGFPEWQILPPHHSGIRFAPPCMVGHPAALLYALREWLSTIRRTQARRFLPFSTIQAPEPKSTWASWPAQHDTKDPGPSFLALLDNPGAGTKIDLGLMAGLTFHPSKRQRSTTAKPAHKTFD